ncbi:hypothetical protein SBA3_1800012 [Candidatus Sulfopaludibacter sp. SbA3]|nr:hypothetical protein SBA3_1800012 [Candidatus Sulfopaludibacter sp. SbA3]
MLEIRSLSKRYSSVLAVQDVSFSIAPGEVLGYVGPNGAGKSTTVKMIIGLLEPTSGQVLFHGQSVIDPGRAASLPAPFGARIPAAFRAPVRPAPQNSGAQDRRIPATLLLVGRSVHTPLGLLQRHAPEDSAFGGAAAQPRSPAVR